jgi:hypothetical protein
MTTTSNLIHAYESYFNIHIPNEDVARIDTIQDAIDSVARQLKIEEEETGVKEFMNTRLNTALIETGRTTFEVKPRQPIFDIIPHDDRTCFDMLANKMGLSVPQPSRKSEEGSSDKFIAKKVNYDYRLITAERFADVICAENFRKVLDLHTINSRYEVAAAVMGITSDLLRIDPYEITPQKSIARDLGTD